MVPIASWLVKEHYGDANSWMNLDVGMSYTDPRAAAISAGDWLLPTVACRFTAAAVVFEPQ